MRRIHDGGSEGEHWPLPLGCWCFVHRWDIGTFVGNHFSLSHDGDIVDRRSASMTEFSDHCRA